MRNIDVTVPPVITGQLLKGERIIWWGRPKRGLMLTHRDLFLVPLSLAWNAFAIIWLVLALRGNAPLWFALLGVPFLFSGFHMFVGRFFVDAFLRARTTYALTDRRALIQRSGWWGAIQSVGLDKLSEASLEERRDGRGTIIFGPPLPVFGDKHGHVGWVPSTQATPQFLAIEDARRIFSTVQGLVQTRS